jgi:2-desacetyl-2-hydroxyethyl bacteriochlorophyllide A dehydrogenase
MNSMNAMILSGPNELELAEVSRPQPRDDEVLIRLLHSSICGTDLKIYSGAIPVRYPRIMGHEMMGEVVRPDERQSFRTGDRVIIDPQLYCGKCYHCGIGQTNLCPHGTLLGRDANGGFTDYIAVPPSHAFLLPNSIDSQTAPLIQVLTTCLHAQRLAGDFAGESVAVIGLGVTGQLHVQLAKAHGARQVIAITRNAEKRNLAQRLGADLTLPSGIATTEMLREATYGRGADLVIDTTGATSCLADAIAMARFGGRLLLFGIFTATHADLPFYQLYFKELRLINARVAKSEDYPVSIDLVDRGVVQLGPLISEIMPLQKLKGAIEKLRFDSGPVVKIVLQN